MNKQIRDILFSNYCLESPIWPFPEVDPDYLPVYNPLIDATFGTLLHFPSESEGSPTELLFSLLETAHESHHESLIDTTHRAVMQLESSLVTHELITYDQSQFRDKLFSSLREELNKIYKGYELVEEIFALRDEYEQFKRLANGTILEGRKEQDFKWLEEAAIDNQVEVFGETFRFLYKRYRKITLSLGARATHMIEHFVMNPPVHALYLSEYLTTNMVGAKYFLNYGMEKARSDELHYSLTSPKERLMAVVSRLESDLPDNLQDCTDSTILKTLEKRIPGFTEGYFYFKGKFIPFLARLNEAKEFSEKAPLWLVLDQILTRNYLKSRVSNKLLTNYIENNNKEDANKLTARQRASIYVRSYTEAQPSSEIDLNPNLVSQDIDLILLLFYESMRQQIYEKKGLMCVGHYFEDFCPFSEHQGECTFKEFLENVWKFSKDHNYSGQKDWVKPPCLD